MIKNGVPPIVADDEGTRADAWTSADLQAAILRELAAGPLHKWKLRDLLGLNEARIVRELQALKAARKVKAVGRRLDDRRWALYAFEEPYKTVPGARPPRTPKRKRSEFPRPLTERYAEIFAEIERDDRRKAGR